MKRDTSNWKTETINCLQCKKSVIVFCFEKRKFCSVKCSVFNPNNKRRKGLKASEESRIKMSKSKKGIVPANILRGDMKGENHPRWIKDRTELLEKHRIRGSIEWRKWSASVFARDLFTCQECSQHGGYLEPHHIIPVRSNTEKLFDTKNGITLCRPCHQKTIWKESDFAEKYTAIIAAQM